MTRFRSLLFIGSLVLATSACGGKSEETPATSDQAAQPAQPPAQPAAQPATQAITPLDEARAMFKTVCAVCHGESGKGDGIGAANLNPKPRDYTDKEWQKTITDDEIKLVILKGGAAVGKSALMPPQAQLEQKPEVLDGLVKLIREFGS